MKRKEGATGCWKETRDTKDTHHDNGDKVRRCSKCGAATGVLEWCFENDRTPCKEEPESDNHLTKQSF